MGRFFLLIPIDTKLFNFYRLFCFQRYTFTFMKMVFFLFPLILSCFSGAFAAYVAVLETTVDSKTKSKVSLADRQFLTNVLREEAVKQLPAAQNYTIMTRDNILQMLPPGKSIEDCEGSCLVETGKNISADFVCQARMGSFGGAFSLSAELYETAGNKLIASFNGQGSDLNELLDLILQKAPKFFKSIKNEKDDSEDSGFINVGDIGHFTTTEGNNVVFQKKFMVEIVTSPSGAIPTIDGRGIPKCPQTPCKVQVAEGKHRFIATHELYKDAEALVEIEENNQKVELKLSPNFGLLAIKPVVEKTVALKGEFNVTVDGEIKEGPNITLGSGVHTVRVKHTCYVPVEFRVAIVPRNTEVFEKELQIAKGTLELHAEYRGRPKSVAVAVDGVIVGETPFRGEVPLCSDIALMGNGWTETVNVQPKWHDVVMHTHKLKNKPKGKILTEERRLKIEAKRAADYAWEMQFQPESIQNADIDESEDYSENEITASTDSIQVQDILESSKLDEYQVSHVGENIPAHVTAKKKKNIHWIPLGIGAGVFTAGVTLAVIGNLKAKNAYETKFQSRSEYLKNRDDAHSGQKMRSIGITLAIAGAVGVGMSFAF